MPTASVTLQSLAIRCFIEGKMRGRHVVGVTCGGISAEIEWQAMTRLRRSVYSNTKIGSGSRLGLLACSRGKRQTARDWSAMEAVGVQCMECGHYGTSTEEVSAR